MTQLEAVNEMLTALGLRPVTSTASGIAAEALTYLERWNAKVQGRGWHYNTERKVTLSVPDTTIAYAVAPSGTFTAGETVTEATSNATGRFNYIEGSKLYLTTLTGDFTGGQVLTGGTSAATVTGTTAAAVSSGYLYVDSDVLSADLSNGNYPDVTLRGGRFYNLDENTYTFSTELVIDQIRKLDFDLLGESAQELITVHALIDFCSKIKVPVPDDARKRLTAAEMSAAQEDGDRADYNLADSTYFRAMGGRRSGQIELR